MTPGHHVPKPPPVIPAPDLPDAACAAHEPDLWAPKRQQHAAWAINICRNHCPALDACAAWADQWKPPSGVWAGRYYGPSE